MQCNAMQCNAMQCNAMQCNAMQSNAMQCNAMQCNAMQRNATQCDAMQCDALQCNAMQCDAMRCNAMLCDSFDGALRIWCAAIAAQTVILRGGVLLRILVLQVQTSKSTSPHSLRGSPHARNIPKATPTAQSLN
jgi:pentapeptide MXKDX repeat protein